jgi:dihydrofolate reductase
MAAFHSTLMRPVVLFIATSADGFIARTTGAIDWLPANAGNDYGYNAFIKTVDSILMGRKTYEQVLTFGPFPYPDKECFVFSRRGLGSRRTANKPPSVRLVRTDPVAFTRRLRNRKGSTIWLVGGARLIRSFQQAGLIDEYIISICPVFIGSGIPLFLKTDRQGRLKLIGHKAYRTGVVQLTYEKVKAKTPR